MNKPNVAVSGSKVSVAATFDAEDQLRKRPDKMSLFSLR
jgi:hypothetical protein